MDPTVLATSLLGGGVSGAIIGGYVSVYLQRRQHDRDDRHRFTPDKRQLYAAFLHESSEHVQALLHQRAVGYGIPRGEATTDDLPTLGTTDKLRWLTEEISILSPTVAAKAERIYGTVAFLDAFAVNTTVRGMNLAIDSMGPLHDAVMEYEQARLEFKRAATSDLGTAP